MQHECWRDHLCMVVYVLTCICIILYSELLYDTIKFNLINLFNAIIIRRVQLKRRTIWFWLHRWFGQLTWSNCLSRAGTKASLHRANSMVPACSREVTVWSTREISGTAKYGAMVRNDFHVRFTLQSLYFAKIVTGHFTEIISCLKLSYCMEFCMFRITNVCWWNSRTTSKWRLLWRRYHCATREMPNCLPSGGASCRKSQISSVVVPCDCEA